MSFLSFHQQVHQSAPLPGARFLFVFPLLPYQPAVHPSPIHLFIHPPPPPPDPFIHGGQRRNRGDKIGEVRRDVSGEEKKRVELVEAEIREEKERLDEGVVKRGVKGEDCRRETV